MIFQETNSSGEKDQSNQNVVMKDCEQNGILQGSSDNINNYFNKSSPYGSTLVESNVTTPFSTTNVKYSNFTSP